MTASRRCYVTEVETACEEFAEYEAKLTWTRGPMLLCEHHAALERAGGDVLEIRRLRPEPSPT